MDVGAGLYMYDVVVKKLHVRYPISWWVLVKFRARHIFGTDEARRFEFGTQIDRSEY